MAQFTMHNPKIARLYQDVPAETVQRLLDFRQRFPAQTVSLNGQTWRYIDTQTGAGPESVPLLVLAGATTIAEVSFQSLEHFAGQHRVIAPDYPPLETLPELFSGLLALLDHLGVGQVVLMGGSYGGWIAQSLVREHPDRVSKLVLTAIGPPDPENSRQLAKMLPLMRLMPAFMLKGLLSRSFSRLDTSQPQDPNMLLLWALAKEALYFHIGRADILALMRRLIDQTEHFTFTPSDLQDWPGKVLLVFGADDPASPPEKREAMQALYPQAEMHVLQGQHAIALTHQQEYFAAIDGFLKS